MRRLFLPLVFVPLAAHAQDANTARSRLADDPTADDTIIEEGADTSDSAGSAGEIGFGGDKPAGGGSASAPESYTVQNGDTLWNLSQRFLNNPWYWPKIWSYNPQLDNPNWIRPGTVLRFYPGEAVVAAPAEIPQEAEFDEPEFDDIGEGGGFEGTIASRADVGSDVRRRDFFIPSDRPKESGELLNSPEEKRMLSLSDRVYLKLTKSGQPGDVLQIFRKERDVRHPITGAVLGQMVMLVGEVRIDQVGRDQALATVISAWEPIERGQYVGELPVNAEKVRPVENSKNAKGYVVDAAPASLSYLGESYVAVIDKGSVDGVQAGNTFQIVRAGDPYTREYSGMSDEEVGELIVVEAFKNSSTAILTSASRAVVPGDRIEMRVK